MKIIGIDLGTTNSVVAICESGVPRVIAGKQGAHLLPSVLHGTDHSVVLGTAAKSKKILDPANTVYSVKRLLGKTFAQIKAYESELPFELRADSQGMPELKLGSTWLSPMEISARLLSELKVIAEEDLKEPVKHAVITVPAYFNDHERQATRRAARLAGLEPVRIVNEPTAAALAYGWTLKKSGTIAVFDLGGGTFDLSILRLHDGVYEVLSTCGDTRLGGDDLDLAIARALASEVESEWGLEPGSAIAQNIELWAALLGEAERVKIALSNQEQAFFEISSQGREFRKSVSRKELAQWIAPVLKRLREPCLTALHDAGLLAKDLDDVVMVGGPTRLKVVQDQAAEIFGRPVNCSLHPDEVVALGAAIQADILAGLRPDLLLLDVTPLSLGIENYGDLVSILIPKNSKVPCTAREVFTTFIDHQTGVDIHVLQGEREQASLNQSLARFKLTPIARMPAGIPRIEVSFSIDPDGILQVSAKDLKSGTEQAIEVTPALGLRADEIQKRLMQSPDQAKQDEGFRAIQESVQAAAPVLRATRKFMDIAKQKLDAHEYDRIQGAVQDLENAIAANDLERIRSSHFVLTRVTEKLADLVIQNATN